MLSSIQPPEISHPQYLPNGDRLKEFYCTIGFKTPQKNSIFVGTLM
jgi:hypothetical protein